MTTATKRQPKMREPLSVTVDKEFRINKTKADPTQGPQTVPAPPSRVIMVGSPEARQWTASRLMN